MPKFNLALIGAPLSVSAKRWQYILSQLQSERFAKCVAVRTVAVRAILTQSGRQEGGERAAVAAKRRGDCAGSRQQRRREQAEARRHAASAHVQAQRGALRATGVGHVAAALDGGGRRRFRASLHEIIIFLEKMISCSDASASKSGVVPKPLPVLRRVYF
ncbi:hypothetical protein FGB62_241g01 [Gracilaria domingensis]|nr:hypothetical protein FGB62_241g01 [Gracilaria domingensis]